MKGVAWYTTDPHKSVGQFKFGTVRIAQLKISEYKNVGYRNIIILSARGYVLRI